MEKRLFSLYQSHTRSGVYYSQFVRIVWLPRSVYISLTSVAQLGAGPLYRASGMFCSHLVQGIARGGMRRS